jgi:transposase
MYLRETKRRNKDGSVARYLQLAHNVRDPDTGVSKAVIIHNFGRAEQVDRDALARLVRSISRELGASDQVALEAGVDITPVDGRDLGAVWVLEALWQRLGIAAAIREVAAGRRVDAEAVERVLFALVANRALEASSKLDACRWVRDEVYVEGLAEMDHTACYRAMDFLLAALAELQETVFFAVADLLQLDVDVIFFDTTSTYFEIERDDDLRRYGHSKDHRDDLPQVVVGMAVTRSGIPVRVWTWPGNTEDHTVIDKVKADLAGWQLNRVIWICDAGFNSADNRRTLQRGGSGYIVAEKLRGNDAEVRLARSRAGRYHHVDGGLEVKDVWVGEGAAAERFIIARNPDEAQRDAAVRAELVAQLEAEIAGSDQRPAEARRELAGRLRAQPGYRRFLRTTPAGKLRLDRTAVRRDAHYDGKYLLRTSDPTLSAADVAQGYKALWEVERGWRDLKHILGLRPIYHRLAERILAHVQLCWLALLLTRTIETQTGDTWRNVRNELNRLQLVTYDLPDGRVSQRTPTTARQRTILSHLGLDEPPRYFQFTPTSD